MSAAAPAKVDLGFLRAHSSTAACEIVCAFLHTVLFSRLIDAPCAPIAHSLVVGTTEMTYAALNDDCVSARVSLAVRKLQHALERSAVGVASVDIMLGSASEAVQRERLRRLQHVSASGAQQRSAQPPSAKILGKVSRWASWLTDTLAQKEHRETLQHKDTAMRSGDATLAALADKHVIEMGVSKVWEQWTLAVHLCDVSADQRNACAKSAQALLDNVNLLLQRRCASVPATASLRDTTFPFFVSVCPRRQLGPLETTEKAKSCSATGQHCESLQKAAHADSRKRSQARAIQRSGAHSAATSSSWWPSMRLSPDNKTWEEGLDLLRDVVGSAPSLSSSPPF